MRQFIAGDGTDTTAAVEAHLTAHRQLYLADLYVIHTAPCYAGQYLGQQFLVTDWPSPLVWGYRGSFAPGTIARGAVESKIGLEADTLEVTWSPKDSDILADDGLGTTLLSALAGFGAGVFDNGVLEVWRSVMPTAGDAATLGACLLFSGRIGDLEPDRLAVKLSVISRMEVLNVQVPTNVIEPTNILAQYSVGQAAAGAPAAFTVASAAVSKLLATASPLMAAGTYDGGYLVMQSGKLAGTYRGIRQQTVESGEQAFYLYQPLPLAAAPGDTFAAFIPVPRDYSAAAALGEGVAAFPFVPSPVNSTVVIA